MGGPNPIERRLGMMREQYLAFADDDAARVLRWQLAADEASMLDAFVQVEAREGATEDLLLLLESPFRAAAGHGHVLVTELAQRYDLLRESLQEAGVADASWRPPRPPGASKGAIAADVVHLRDTAASFHEHHQPLLRRFTLVLRPSSIADPAVYVAWLSQATTAFDDPTCKLVLVESKEAPAFDAVQPVEHVRVTAADLDMPAAMHEINAGSDLESPAGRFRTAFLHLSEAVAEHDMPTAKAHGDEALAIARGEGWTHLVVATHYTLGAAYLGEAQHPAAMQSFREAEAEATTAETAGEPWAGQLVLQSRLGQGAVCVATQSWPLGARIYGDAALRSATALGDARMQIEALRMAAYCNEQHRELALAWDQCVHALAVGARIPVEERGTTTLAWVGEAMLRLCTARGFRGRERAVHDNMQQLLGPDWRPDARPRDVAAETDISEPSPLETSPPAVSTVPASLQKPVRSEADP